MPVSGSGIIPASGAIYNELSYLTRRAFVPKMVVQVYQASPTIATFLSNAQSASGGVSPITVPVQGGQFVKTAAAGYDGSFAAPQDLQGAYNAEFNLGSIVTPIPFLGMESLVQVNASVIPILEARMNDAGNSQAEYYSLALWNSDATSSTNATDSFSNTITYSGLDISGFPALFSATSTYGGLSRSSYSWFQPGIKSVNGSPAPTRASVLQYIISATKTNGGEMPNFGVTGMGTWSLLAQDFLAQEYYTVGPGEGFDKTAGGVRAGFVALVVGGVPIYCDPYATEGSFYFFNDKYACFYLHEDASFAFTGFASSLPNFQLGYVGAVVTLGQFVCMKPKAATVVSGYAYNSI